MAAKLNVLAFGLAFGIVWGVGMFILGLATMFLGLGGIWVALMTSVYMGYQPTFLGSIIGAIWGFVDAGVGGIVIAWLYNKLQK